MLPAAAEVWMITYMTGAPDAPVLTTHKILCQSETQP